MLKNRSSEKRREFYFSLLIFIFLFSNSCAVSQKTCIKNETSYCRTRGNFTGQWYNFYERALSCIEGECYNDALSDLNEAVNRRYEDQRRARTLGMHFTDYFPHREKGVIHYLDGRYDEAKQELELSVQQYPSEKAFFYLDEVRKKIMEQSRQPLSVPELTLLLPKWLVQVSDSQLVQVSDLNQLRESIIWTKDDPVTISGIAEDQEQYISEIIIGEKPVFIESSQKRITFTEDLRLEQGKHEITLIVRNLRGGEKIQKIIIHVDRTGPVILLEKFIPGKSVKGYLYDESGDIFFWINEKPADIPKGEYVRFDIALKPDEYSVNILAKDKLGNETEMYADENMTVFNLSDMMTAQSQNVTADTGKNFSYTQTPEITVRGMKDNLTEERVFKESITLPIEIKSKNGIESLSINDVPQKIYRSGKFISLNHFTRLNTGENKISIAVKDTAGNTVVKDIHIIRKISEVFQLKHRYALVMHPFESPDGLSEQGLFQYYFLDDLIAGNRFQIFIRKEMKEILEKSTFRDKKIAEGDPSGVSGSVILGVIYNTKNGIEIAGRLVDIETRETIASADVYNDSKEQPALEAMAKRLSEKFHRSLPLIDCNINHISENRIIITPEKWIPAKGNIRKEFPLIVYREKTPEKMEYGSDTEIICGANTDTVKENGDIILIVKKNEESKIRPGDRVISQ